MLVGQFDEAIRRRREAELSRAQLQQKIEAFKRRRSREEEPGQAPQSATPGMNPASEAAAARARAEAAHRREIQRKDAEDRVSDENRDSGIELLRAHKVSVLTICGGMMTVGRRTTLCPQLHAAKDALQALSCPSHRVIRLALWQDMKLMGRLGCCVQVRAAYFRYAGNHDVAAFMRALGFEMPAHWFLKKDPSPSELARIAIQVHHCHCLRDQNLVCTE